MNAPIEATSTGIGLIPEPAVAPSVPWKLTTALGALGVMLVVSGLAIITNPWSLVILRSNLAIGLATIWAVVLAAGFALASIFQSEIGSSVLRVDGDTVVVRLQQQYGLGPDSSCIRFEIRVGTGWTARLDGDVLTLTVRPTTNCTYRIDGPSRSLQPLVADDCESFGV